VLSTTPFHQRMIAISLKGDYSQYVIIDAYSKPRNILGVLENFGFHNYDNEYNEFTRVYQQIKDMSRPFVELVRLIQNAGMSKAEITSLLEISKDYPRVSSQYEKLKADTNVLENEISNLAKVQQRLSGSISNLHKTENQLQLAIKEFQAKLAKLDLQR
jgi:chromosome segregation ATPase